MLALLQDVLPKDHGMKSWSNPINFVDLKFPFQTCWSISKRKHKKITTIAITTAIKQPAEWSDLISAGGESFFLTDRKLLLGVKEAKKTDTENNKTQPLAA